MSNLNQYCHPFVPRQILPLIHPQFVLFSPRFPDQRLTRLEALRGMTIDPAYASFTEATLGSLEPGKRADYVVLSKDIMDEGAEFGEVMKTKVVATVIDGRVVFGEA